MFSISMNKQNIRNIEIFSPFQFGDGFFQNKKNKITFSFILFFFVIHWFGIKNKIDSILILFFF